MEDVAGGVANASKAARRIGRTGAPVYHDRAGLTAGCRPKSRAGFPSEVFRLPV